MPQPPSKGVVAVTGAAGFIGSWCVKVLVDRGYIVRACVRSADDQTRVGFLQKLAPQQISLHSCDLSAPGAYDSAFSGCDAVIHTAAGIWSGPTNMQDQKGQYNEMTRGIQLFIDSVNKAQSVRRVVYTSSAAAMLDANVRLIERNPIVDENRYPDMTDKLASNPSVFGYPSAKVLSERQLGEASAASSGHWDVVMVNPGEVIGPILSPHQLYGWAASVAQIAAGEEQAHMPYHRPLIAVDVRDVAEAHVALLESSSLISGSRFLVVSSDKVYFSDMGRYISAALPELKGVPTTCGPSFLGKMSSVDAELLWSRVQLRNDAVKKATGMTFRPLLDTLRDNVMSVKTLCGEQATSSGVNAFKAKPGVSKL